MLQANGNLFSGSIPPKIGQMSELQQLYLHSNDLFGTIPPEIGQLKNMKSLSLSYNNIKSSIPAEIGRLTKLDLLHLHGNELEGKADYFKKDEVPKSFITDCGNTATTASLVDCLTCSQCCNENEECITESATWPKLVLKKWNEKYDVQSAVGVFALMLIWWITMIYAAWILYSFKQKLPKTSYLHENQFQDGSVYRFFLASSKRGKHRPVINILISVYIKVFNVIIFL